MGSHVVEEPLQLRWRFNRLVPPDQHAQPHLRIGVNALMGMGLWLLLWLGYNADPGYLMDPNFPNNNWEIFHAFRAFSPFVAAWIAGLVIVARSNRLQHWLSGPLGLMLLYAAAGLASSVTLSPDPLFASYFGIDYLAIVLVLLALVLVEDPLPDLRKVLSFTWIMGIAITLSLLLAIPFLGAAAVAPEDVGPRAYGSVHDIMGMAGTRNTGFARYAAISALVALPPILRKGNLFLRALWAIILAAALYALFTANGRTETIGFIGGLLFIMLGERSKRTANALITVAGATLLGLRGFYSAFYMYITRTGHFDFTMTGRVTTWQEGWRFIASSPWVGLGFQADRYTVGQHMHNAFLHVLIQAGLLGGLAMLLSVGITWYYILKYFILRRPADKSLIPLEIPAVFMFVTISSFMESTFAYFSATWLLSAPIVAYVLALHLHLRKVRAKAAWEKLLRWRLSQSGLPALAAGKRMEVVLPTPRARGGKL